MADNEQTTEEVTQDVTAQETQQNEQDNSVLRKLRKELTKANQELEALKKAEEDKTKSIEEKLAEERAKAETLSKQIEATNRKYELEKALLQNNVNPEFLDLMLARGATDEDLSIVVSELKTQYPSAFVKEDVKPQPIGKVGVSVTNSPSTVLTKEEVQKLLLDPNKPLTPEVSKLADEYGL